MISKQRVEDLIDFLTFEKEVFMGRHSGMNEENYNETLVNFNDTIEVVKSVLNEM